MTENEAQKQSGEIISNALSAASEILNLPNRPAQDMIDISQRLADRIIQAAKELSGSGVKSAVNVPPESVRTSKVFSVSDISQSKMSKYDGERITVRGRISYIAEFETGFTITLSDDMNHKLYCYFSSEWENTILTLKNGQGLIVKGKWHGGNSPELEDCEILKDRIIRTPQKTGTVLLAPRSFSMSEIISVASVFREYEENPIVAKRKYEGRRITVQGKAYYIIGNEQELWFVLREHSKDYYKLECYFLPEWENIIHTIEKGQTITVNGEWRYFAYSQADLHDCKILSVE